MNKLNCTISGPTAMLRIIMLCLLVQLCPGLNAQAQMNQMNQMNRMNRMNQMNRMTQMNRVSMQPGITDRVLALAYIHKLDEQAVQGLLLPLKKAEDQDFPIHTLLMKIKEGLSKKIAVKRIVATLDMMITGFERLDLILKRLPPHVQIHRKRKLHLMSGLVAMGIKPEEIEARLAMSNGFPPAQVFKALETKVALSNAGLSSEDVERIVEKGLTSGFFQRPGCRNLAYLAHAAGKLGIEAEQVKQLSMQIVSGQKTIGDVARELGVDNHCGDRKSVV